MLVRPARCKRGAAIRHSNDQRGGTGLGLLIGLFLGLAIAVAVALFVTRAPVPFANPPARPVDRGAVSISPDADPNAGLRQDRGSPATDPEAARALAALEGRDLAPRSPFGGSVQSMPPSIPFDAQASQPTAPLPGNLEAGTSQSISSGGAQQPPAPIVSLNIPVPSVAAPSADGQFRYMLQVGAFRSQRDADALRARVALAGYEVRVEPADVQGVTWYRVRLGPFSGLDALNEARMRMSEAGLQSSVVRLAGG